ncbi:ergothioneine biosynthesis protein EgtC [Arthrobacter sp. H5]|uniref:ergothioneine biosynthesis protein EgtC n=1 Tax=Arthrobacter sp. H5 TaxID=1267973 RepID=UPI000683DA3F|nr:ergothioneine biosynthesis protein EgtC [Arthrobacter sp. H5]
MCRHLAFLGPPTSLAALLLAPGHGLLTQSWAPRLQQYGTVNADGFGVGWYADGDPKPARYRRAVPMWADPSFADVARVTTTTAALAAVRSATVGTTQDESASAPYTDGKWLFSHNGRIHGWPSSVERIVDAIPAARLLTMEAHVDSALLWALVLESLAAGQSPDAALAGTARTVLEHAEARMNLLLTDGTTITATAVGDTLYWRSGPDGVLVASEPSDDASGWHRVPDNSVLTATTDRVDVRPISYLEIPGDAVPRPTDRFPLQCCNSAQTPGRLSKG